jgi:cytochrome c peroxidase
MSLRRRIALSSHAPPRLRATSLLTSSALLALAACIPGSPSGDTRDAGAPPDAPLLPCFALQASAAASLTPCAPPPPPPPWPDSYFALTPKYQTTPEGAFSRFEIHGRTITANDFQTADVSASVEQKLDEVGTQIGRLHGLATVDLIPNGEQRTRASGIPFRGNPTDIALLTVGGKRRAYVPLGGDVMSPGNEVASVDLDTGTVHRIQVGVRPQQLYAHAGSGLVFVCNEYASFISVIDGRKDALLEPYGFPLMLPAPLFCTDLLAVERDPQFPEPDQLHLYVASEQRGSVLKYAIDVQHDINDDVADIQVLPPPGEDPHTPIAEILDVGASPSRLHLDETGTRLYVASHAGGELAVIDVATDRLIEKVALGAPAIDVVQVDERLFVPTTTPYRGLLQDGAPTAADVQAPPITAVGVDGQLHEVHPGARFDATASYDVEDLRSGIFQLRADTPLTDSLAYVTDDNDADAAFAAEQKQLAGALPRAITRNQAGTRVYVPLFGSDMVQELEVTADTIGLRASGRTFATRELPAAVALDEGANQLVVASFGGDALELYDLASGDRVSEIDLGYAAPRYPATTIEAGEYLFATAKWSNDGRKSCAGCHSQRLSSDGLGFAVGTAAPTTLRPVKPMHDLFATGPYLWSGGAPGGNLGAMALAAQTRTSCALVLYGLVEGPHTPPAQRNGDPANFTHDPAGDARCRPDVASQDPITGLPDNLAGEPFADILAEIQAQEQTATEAMTAAVRPQLASAGLLHDDAVLDRQEMERAIGFYTVSELRLPPNALAEMRQLRQLDLDTERALDKGAQIFHDLAGCASCHDGAAQAHPFTDNRYYGRGSDWLRSFVTAYANTPLLGEILPGGIPAPLADAAAVDTVPGEPTSFQPVLDTLVPLCFSADACLRFDDPLLVRNSDSAEEERRLRRLATIYLAGAGFLPGAIVGEPMVNTPSLRSVWLQRSLLHHGQARSLEETFLPPGHAALRAGKHGYAVDHRGGFDVHGTVRDLDAEQVDALVRYLQSIQ